MSTPIRHVLVPVDGSEYARHAAAFASRLAQGGQVDITLLHVVHANTAVAVGMTESTGERLRARLDESAAPWFAAARAAMDPDTPAERIHEAVELGDVAHAICNLSHMRDVDLIVMGSRGLGLTEGMLVGSVSEQVIEKATCPVTVVH